MNSYFKFIYNIHNIIENKRRRTIQDIIKNKQLPDIEFAETALIVCSVLVVFWGIAVCLQIIFGPMESEEDDDPRYR